MFFGFASGDDEEVVIVHVPASGFTSITLDTFEDDDDEEEDSQMPTTSNMRVATDLT